MADDWECKDDRPITDFHWWGSYIGWTQPHPPLVVPKAFHIGIWTNVPPGIDETFSHPGKLIWETYCANWVWNFAGYDVVPEGQIAPENEACFQFTQLLNQDEWFYQEPQADGQPTIYWLSIAAIYDQAQPPTYPWGWKTRPHMFEDDAVRIRDVAGTPWPPVIGSHWIVGGGEAVELQGVSWDLAFELTTNRPGPPSADLNNDGIVNLRDLAIMGAQWLTAGP